LNIPHRIVNARIKVEKYHPNQNYYNNLVDYPITNSVKQVKING